LYNEFAEKKAIHNPPAEIFARMNQLLVLYHAGRYQEMLDLYAKVSRRFPQIVTNRDDSGLGWYVKEAKNRLAADREKKTTKSHVSGRKVYCRPEISNDSNPRSGGSATIHRTPKTIAVENR
jgi:hypothetical protein